MLCAKRSEEEARVKRSQLDAGEGNVSMHILGALMGGLDHLPGTDVDRAKESSGKEGEGHGMATSASLFDYCAVLCTRWVPLPLAQLDGQVMQHVRMDDR